MVGVKNKSKDIWKQKYENLYAVMCEHSEQNIRQLGKIEEKVMLAIDARDRMFEKQKQIFDVAQRIKSKHSSDGVRCLCDVCKDMDKILKQLES